MNIEIKINLDNYEEWNQEVIENNQQTFFISQKFLNYHPKGRFEQFNIFIYLEEKLYLIIPGTKKQREVFSHNGATYGGVVQFFETEKKNNKEIFIHLKKFLKKQNVDVLKFRLPPDLFISKSRNSFLQSIDNIQNLFEEEETYVDLQNKDIENLASTGFRRNHQRDIKKILLINEEIKIEKISKDSEVEEYYKILVMNLKKHKVLPTHSLDELKWLISNLSDYIWIDVLKYENKIISGIVYFEMNKNVLHYFYGSIDYTFKYQGAIKYLYWQSMIKAKKLGYNYINFGVDSKFGENPNDNLKSFKEGFGGTHVYRKTVKIDV